MRDDLDDAVSAMVAVKRTAESLEGTFKDLSTGVEQLSQAVQQLAHRQEEILELLKDTMSRIETLETRSTEPSHSESESHSAD